jgi:hypothetical protein
MSWRRRFLLGAIALTLTGGAQNFVSAQTSTTTQKKVSPKKKKPKAKLKKLQATKARSTLLSAPAPAKTEAVPVSNEKLPTSNQSGVVVTGDSKSSSPAPLSRYAGKMSKAPRFAPTARELAKKGEYLALRVFIRKNYSKLAHPADWILLRDLIIENADKIGFDLIYAWDKRLPGAYVDSGEMDINSARAAADGLMSEGRFQEAFDGYQKIAVELRKLKREAKTESQVRNIEFLMPYIFQSMGRALYGAGRFDEAYIVLRWIPQNYAKFRQVQFEKMWAAFRGGRIDQALGAVASQHSSYFARYSLPEAYLVQTYLYKKLCRDDDYQQVLKEIYQFRDKLSANKLTIEEWVGSDNEIRVLWALANSKIKKDLPVKEEDLIAEQSRIMSLLTRSFENQKSRLLDDLEKSVAYVQLTVRSGSGTVLKPIEKLPDRSAFFELDLEVWPADSLEEWADEVGTHRFIGESLCKTNS